MAQDDAIDKRLVRLDAEKLDINQSKRKFFKWFLGGLFTVSAAAIIYPFIRYLLPPQTAVSASSVRIGKVSDFPQNTSHLFKFASYPALLINYEGNYYCYGAICTHLGCIVHWQDKGGCAMQMGAQIHCVCHGGHYDLRTGDVLAGPPPKALPKITLKVKGDDIYAEDWENPDYVKTLATY